MVLLVVDRLDPPTPPMSIRLDPVPPGRVVAVSIWLPLVGLGALDVVVGGLASRILSAAGWLGSAVAPVPDAVLPWMGLAALVVSCAGGVEGVPVAPVMSALLHLCYVLHNAKSPGRFLQLSRWIST